MDRCRVESRWARLRSPQKRLMMCILRAGVAKLVYAPDSKSGEVHSSCRFESDLRHHSSAVNCRAQCFHHINLKHLYSLSLVPDDLVDEDGRGLFARDN